VISHGRAITEDCASPLKVNEHLQSELSQSIGNWTSRLEFLKTKLHISDTKLKVAQKDISWLHKVCHRATGVKERAMERTKAKVLQQKSVHHLMKKGVFTEETRNLVCLLARAGCSGNYINEVIVAVLQSADISTIGQISRPSVTRIIREGFYAAQIQLGYEMTKAKSITLSADGTSHRSINYNSQHAHLLVEDYDAQGNDKQKQATHFLGIRSACDGSSDEAIADWQLIMSDVVDLYNCSPFGKCSGGGLLQVIDILIKLTGMNTDHCAKEKKDAQKMAELKEWAVDQYLDESAMFEKSMQVINELYKRGEREMIRIAGDNKKWEALSPVVQAEKYAGMLEKVVADLGKEAFEMLSDDEKRMLLLFIWAGCGCHKYLNTVHGGYTAMSQWWKANGCECRT